MPSVAFHTLGCKVNQIETEHIKENFIKRGYIIADFTAPADIYIINTCTVTHVSDRKSRAMIRRAVRRNPGAIIAAIGCSAQVNTEELAALEGVNLVVGNKDKENVVDIIESYAAANQCQIYAEPITSNDKLKPMLFSRPHDRTRAFIKIQDGCQSFCSYCIVPTARGPIRSKPLLDVLSEVKQLLSLGYKEIVLTGIHTGFYGRDLGKIDLVELLKQILDVTKNDDFRLRLSSIEPLEVSDELIDLVKNEKSICNHFHIPLQSGSDKVLKDMNRRYTSGQYEEIILKIKAAIPDAAIAADVMVGFPTETEEEFNYTYNLITRLPLTHLHIFKYSKRPGTKAALIPSVVEEAEKNLRSEKLIDLARDKHHQFVIENSSLIMDLLVEQQISDCIYKGLTDNYIEMEFTADKNMVGKFVQISLKEIDLQTDKITAILINKG